MICDLFICSILCQPRPGYKQLRQILVFEPVCAYKDSGANQKCATIVRLCKTECGSR